MSRELGDLRSDVKVEAVAALADIKSAGVTCTVTCTYRSLHHQIALFAQNRCPLSIVNHLRLIADLMPITEAENKTVVTQCDGINKRSSHQDGRALDVVVIKNGKSIWRKELAVTEYKKIGEIIKYHGFVWGGEWPPLDKNGIGWDYCHMEMV